MSLEAVQLYLPHGHNGGLQDEHFCDLVQQIQHWWAGVKHCSIRQARAMLIPDSHSRQTFWRLMLSVMRACAQVKIVTGVGFFGLAETGWMGEVRGAVLAVPAWRCAHTPSKHHSAPL